MYSPGAPCSGTEASLEIYGTPNRALFVALAGYIRQSLLRNRCLAKPSTEDAAVGVPMDQSCASLRSFSTAFLIAA